MSGAESLTGEVGDFVVLQAGLLSQVHKPFVATETQFFVGFAYFPFLEHVVERRPLLELQGVGREMGNIKVQHFADVARELLQALTGQTIDEIEAQVRVVRRLQQFYGPSRLCCRMASPQGAQYLVVEALHAHADTVYGRIVQGRHPFRRHIVRIGFYRDFCICRQAKVSFYGIE